MAAIAAAMLSCDCMGGMPGNPGGGRPKGGGAMPRGCRGIEETDVGGILGAGGREKVQMNTRAYT